MNNYLIRFTDSDITTVFAIAPDAEIMGANHQHIVTQLTNAMVLFYNMGYEIDKLVQEYDKPDVE